MRWRPSENVTDLGKSVSRPWGPHHRVWSGRMDLQGGQRRTTPRRVATRYGVVRDRGRSRPPLATNSALGLRLLRQRVEARGYSGQRASGVSCLIVSSEIVEQLREGLLRIVIEHWRGTCLFDVARQLG